MSSPRPDIRGLTASSAARLPSGRLAGDVLVLLFLGYRLRSGVYQSVRVLPGPDQGLGQRPRVGPSAKPHTQGFAFTELSNGSATCEDPRSLQEICDRLGP
jgi:hypothetical protein